jgi:hypothetical protein
MATGETSGGIPESERNQAYVFCENFRGVMELSKIRAELEGTVHRAGALVIQESMLWDLPFRLQVSIPEGVEAYVVHDGDVIIGEPKEFMASELRSIDQHGVEFYDRETDRWLRVRGYDIEVNPVFENPNSPNSPPST